MTSVEWLVCSQIPDVIVTMKVYIKSILYHVLTAFVLTVVLVICDSPPIIPDNRELNVHYYETDDYIYTFSLLSKLYFICGSSLCPVLVTST
jgi:hypothetical protein